MKTILLSLIIILSVSCGKAQSQSETATTETVYYLIRHAEKNKSDKSNKDPELLEKGYQRALRWAKYFETIHLDAVYSTRYKRTKSTAKPTAKSKGLKTILYSPKTLNYKDFFKKTKGKTTLIVGHSNTTPAFVNKLIKKDKYPAIDETINSKLFIVTVTEDKTTSKVINVD